MKASAHSCASMRIRVLIANDHQLVCHGLRALLERETDIEVIGCACDGLEAVRLARELQPDVLVTDVSMPRLNGLEVIRRVHGENPGIRLLCLSMRGNSRMVLAALSGGASGYILKDCSSEELVLGIRKLMANKVHISIDLMDVVVSGLRQPVQSTQPVGGPALTPRERELVQLLSEGYSSNDVAERLHVSIKTVATHREHVMRKLRVGSVAELTRYALREGLSTLDTPCASALSARNAPTG